MPLKISIKSMPECSHMLYVALNIEKDDDFKFVLYFLQFPWYFQIEKWDLNIVSKKKVLFFILYPEAEK